jgi:hypothetical protein
VTTQPAIDENKLNEFIGRFVGDLGAVAHAATLLIGDKLGQYSRYPGVLLLLSLSPLMDGHQALLLTLASSSFRESLMPETCSCIRV